MKRENYPIYQSGIQFYLACENQNFYRTLDNPDLSQTERILLGARKLFSVNQYREAIELLGTISPSCSFLLAEKHLLTATAHSNLGEWENAFLHNSRAIESYKISQDQRGHFLSTYNLSVDAGFLGLKKISLEYIEKASHLAVKLEEKLLVHRARACGMSAERKYTEAYEEILKALSICRDHQDGTTNKLDILTLKVVASDIFFRAGHADLARDILEEIRFEKLLKPKARVFFNLGLIKFLKTGDLGPMPKNVSDSTEYSLKWNILAQLNSGDISSAQKSWRELIKSFPNNFNEGFEAATQFDGESLFFTCVKAIRNKASHAPVVSFPTGSKIEILHNQLINSKGPLRKEELIEKIWKCSYDPSYDSRFYKLIQRLKEMSLPIANDHRAYYYKSS